MIDQSIRRPVTVVMAYTTVAALGVLAWRNIPIELLPDTDLPQLTITAGWPGSSPEVVEAFLTSPIEAEVQQVRGVEKVTSTSTEANTSITVQFALETDMEFARMELSERLGALEDRLPVGSSPPSVTPYVPDDFEDQRSPLLTYMVTGPYTLETLREYLEDDVEPQLAQVEGVGYVEVLGGRRRVLEIELDEERIQALGLRPEAVNAAVRAMEIVREAGAVRTASGLSRTLAIRERAENIGQIRQLPVLIDQGRIVRVGDVARLHDTYEEARGYYRIDGFPAAAVYIRKAPRVNAVATADRVKAAIALVEPHAPKGVRFILDENSDQSTRIRAQLSDLRNRALISATIVLCVLLLFLRSFRAAIIVFSTVLFAELIALNFIYFGGLTLNVLTLMGLAMGFGLVVDNAIVVLENTYRLRKRGLSALEAARSGAREVVVPILGATGTTVVVMIPFVYLQGELRIYYVPLAIVVGLSLIASFFVAFTFIPALASRLLGKRGEGTPAPVVGESREQAAAASGSGSVATVQQIWIVRLYSGLVRTSLRHAWTTVVVAVLMLGGCYYLFNKYVSRGM
ncbi:MAG: efflux RND transporter permease subunit, partial [Gemmatimonadetes bacterium]|nr:efflux RND transporter permease subunit [Gemmatimonadota bacterium]